MAWADVIGEVAGDMMVQVQRSFVQPLPCDILIYSHAVFELLGLTRLGVQNQLLIIFPFVFLVH